MDVLGLVRQLFSGGSSLSTTQRENRKEEENEELQLSEQEQHQLRVERLWSREEGQDWCLHLFLTNSSSLGEVCISVVPPGQQAQSSVTPSAHPPPKRVALFHLDSDHWFGFLPVEDFSLSNDEAEMSGQVIPRRKFCVWIRSKGKQRWKTEETWVKLCRQDIFVWGLRRGLQVQPTAKRLLTNLLLCEAKHGKKPLRLCQALASFLQTYIEEESTDTSKQLFSAFLKFFGAPTTTHHGCDLRCHAGGGGSKEAFVCELLATTVKTIADAAQQQQQQQQFRELVMSVVSLLAPLVTSETLKTCATHGTLPLLWSGLAASYSREVMECAVGTSLHCALFRYAYFAAGKVEPSVEAEIEQNFVKCELSIVQITDVLSSLSFEKEVLIHAFLLLTRAQQQQGRAFEDVVKLIHTFHSTTIACYSEVIYSAVWTEIRRVLLLTLQHSFHSPLDMLTAVSTELCSITNWDRYYFAVFKDIATPFLATLFSENTTRSESDDTLISITLDVIDRIFATTSTVHQPTVETLLCTILCSSSFAQALPIEKQMRFLSAHRRFWKSLQQDIPHWLRWLENLSFVGAGFNPVMPTYLDSWLKVWSFLNEHTVIDQAPPFLKQVQSILNVVDIETLLSKLLGLLRVGCPSIVRCVGQTCLERIKSIPSVDAFELLEHHTSYLWSVLEMDQIGCLLSSTYATILARSVGQNEAGAPIVSIEKLIDEKEIWKRYWTFCLDHGIDLERHFNTLRWSKHNNVEGNWSNLCRLANAGAKCLISFLAAVKNQSIVVPAIEFLHNHIAPMKELMGVLLIHGFSENDLIQADHAIYMALQEFDQNMALLGEFLDHWEPALQSKLNVSALEADRDKMQHRPKLTAKLLLGKNFLPAIRIIGKPTLLAFSLTKQNKLLLCLWVHHANQTRQLDAISLVASFRDFIVTDFYVKIVEGHIKLAQVLQIFDRNTIEADLKALALFHATCEVESTSHVILPESRVSQRHECPTAEKALSSARESLWKYLNYDKLRHNVTLLFDCIRLYDLDNGGRDSASLRHAIEGMNQLTQQHTLREAGQHLDTLARLPVLSEHCLTFLHELRDSVEVVHWMASNDSQTLQHEIDVCRKAMNGNVAILHLLADLEAVRELLFRLISPNKEVTCRFDCFIEALQHPLLVTAVSHEQLRAVRLHMQEIINTLEEVRGGKTFLGVEHLIRDLNSFGAYYLRSRPTGETAWSTVAEFFAIVEKPASKQVVYKESQLRALAKKLILSENSIHESFLEQFRRIVELHETLKRVHDLYHFEMQVYEENLKVVDATTKILDQQLERMRYKEQQWRRMLVKYREEFPGLNFLTARELYILHFSLSKKLAMPASTVLHLVGCHSPPSFEEWKNIQATVAEERIAAPTVELQLCAVARYVETVYRRCAVGQLNKTVSKRRTHEEDKLPPFQLFLSDQMQPERGSADTCWIEEVLSLYITYKKRLPCHYELLLCDASMDMGEEISLFLQRCSITARQENDDSLFCIVWPERLDAEVQGGLLKKLAAGRTGEVASSYGSNLIFLVRSPSSPLGYGTEHTVMKPCPKVSVDVLRKAIQDQFQQHNLSVKVVVSSRPGDGKSFVIKTKEFSSRRSRMVTFYSSTTMKRFVTDLGETPLNAIHFNVENSGSYGDGLKEPDIVFFKLLISGLLKDPVGNIYYLQDGSVFNIELNLYPHQHTIATASGSWQQHRLGEGAPSTEVTWAASTSPFFLLLPTTIVEPACNPFCLDNPTSSLLVPLLRKLDLSTAVADSDSTFIQAIQALVWPHKAQVVFNNYCALSASIKLMAYIAGHLIQNHKADGEKRFLAIAHRLLAFCGQWFFSQHSDDSGHGNEGKQANSCMYPLPWVQATQKTWLPTITKTDVLFFTPNEALCLPKPREEELETCNFLSLRESSSLLDCLSLVFGTGAGKRLESNDFVLTCDNVAKLALLRTFVLANVPTIMMGETGCGKTFLIRALANMMDVPMGVLDLHGGISEEYLLRWISSVNKEANAAKKSPFLVFFDEVNTCEASALIKEIFCDRSWKGRSLSRNIAVLAACNPYRQRACSLTHQQFAFNVGGGQAISYQVFPLPKTLNYYLWDFGKLSQEDEVQYAIAMAQKLLLKHLRPERPMPVETMANLICHSQRFLEQSAPDLSPTSLRDIKRCLELLPWFLDQIATEKSPFYVDSTTPEATAIILSLAICYLFRLLGPSRKEYMETIAHESDGLFSSVEFHNVVELAEKQLVTCFNLSEGISPNRALRENLLLAFVCILTKIPLLIIGKSGTSKSLSLHILFDNMRGRRSVSPFLRHFPALQCFTFQCSRFTSAEAISTCFHEASHFQTRAGEQNFISTVVLDEIGLAELNPTLPLKVLHSLLEDARLGFVGLSNYALDPAKMNRAIHFFHSAPNKEELIATALDIAGGEGLNTTYYNNALKRVAKAILSILEDQAFSDFYGLRDFYHLAYRLRRDFLHSDPRTLTPATEKNIVMHAFAQQFGGCSRKESARIIELAAEALKDENGEDSEKQKERLQEQWMNNVKKMVLIQNNLRDKTARHLMIIAREGVARHILLNHFFNLRQTWDVDEAATQKADSCSAVSQFRLLEGNRFAENEKDEASLHYYLLLIKECMREGKVLVLINMDHRVYECLYDVLNGRCTQVGSVEYARIAVGSESETCIVHPGFKVITVHDPISAYRLPSPFLNRFEKHVLRWSDVASTHHLVAASKLQTWIASVEKAMNVTAAHYPASSSSSSTFSSSSASSSSPSSFSSSSSASLLLREQHCFFGYNSDSVYSLLQKADIVKLGVEATIERCQMNLCWLLRPEAYVKLVLSSLRSGENFPPEAQQLVRDYPRFYRLDTLQAFWTQCESPTRIFSTSFPTPADFPGKRFVLFTYSPFGLAAEDLSRAEFVHLSASTTQAHFAGSVATFWQEPATASALIVACSLDELREHTLSYCLRICLEEGSRAADAAQNVPQHKPRGIHSAPKDMFFIVHLPNGRAKSKLRNLDFTDGWHYIFIEHLYSSPLQGSGCLSLDHLLAARHWSDLYLEGHLDCTQVLRSNVVRCVSEMTFAFLCDSSENSAALYDTVGAIQTLLSDDDLEELVQKQLHVLLNKAKQNDLEEGAEHVWQKLALEQVESVYKIGATAQPLQFWLTQYAQHKLVRLATLWLSRLHRNGNLFTIDKSTRLWRDMLSRAIYLPEQFWLLLSTCKPIVKWDFTAQFPFSFFYGETLCKQSTLIISMSSSSHAEKSFQNFVAHNYPELVAGDNTSLIKAYVHDLGHLQAGKFRPLSSHFVTYYLLEVSRWEGLTSIADVHLSLRKREELFSSLGRLVELMPELHHPQRLNLGETDEGEFLLSLCERATNVVCEDLHSCRNYGAVGLWLSRTKPFLLAVKEVLSSNLLSLKTPSGAKVTRAQRFETALLLLFSQQATWSFVFEVAFPNENHVLALLAGFEVKVAPIIRTKLYSVEALRSMTKFLFHPNLLLVLGSNGQNIAVSFLEHFLLQHAIPSALFFISSVEQQRCNDSAKLLIQCLDANITGLQVNNKTHEWSSATAKRIYRLLLGGADYFNRLPKDPLIINLRKRFERTLQEYTSDTLNLPHCARYVQFVRQGLQRWCLAHQQRSEVEVLQGLCSFLLFARVTRKRLPCLSSLDEIGIGYVLLGRILPILFFTGETNHANFEIRKEAARALYIVVNVNPEDHWTVAGFRVLMLRKLFALLGESNALQLVTSSDFAQYCPWIEEMTPQLPLVLSNVPTRDFGHLYNPHFQSVCKIVSRLLTQPLETLGRERFEDGYLFDRLFFFAVWSTVVPRQIHSQPRKDFENLQRCLLQRPNLDDDDDDDDGGYSNFVVQVIDGTALGPLALSHSSSLDAVCLSRLVLVSFVTLYRQRQANFFQALVDNSTILLQQSYLPTMPEDLFSLLPDVTQIWRCPCGHIYGIGHCGRPMEAARCPDCGRGIGGQSHNPINGNTAIRGRPETDNFRGYVVDSSLTRDARDSQRHLLPKAFRLIRFWMHCCLLVKVVFHLGSSCAVLQTAEFYWQRLQADFDALQQLYSSNPEQLCEYLHCILWSLDIELEEGLALVFPAKQFWHSQDRLQWEQNANHHIAQMDSKLSHMHQQSRELVDAAVGVGSKLLREIRGTLLEEEITPEYCSQKVPSLFVSEKGDLLEEFKLQFLQDKGREQYPLIALILDHAAEIELLQRLPEVIAFLQLVKDVFSYHITLIEAQTLSIHQCVEKVPPEKQELFCKLFDIYMQVWNTIGTGENRFECEEVTIVELSFKSSILHCITHKEAKEVFLVLKKIGSLQNNLLYQAKQSLEMSSLVSYSALMHLTQQQDKTNNIWPQLQIAKVQKRHLIGTTNILQYLQTIITEQVIETQFKTICWDFVSLQHQLFKDLFLGRPILIDDIESWLVDNIFCFIPITQWPSQAKIESIIPQTKLSKELMLTLKQLNDIESTELLFQIQTILHFVMQVPDIKPLFSLFQFIQDILHQSCQQSFVELLKLLKLSHLNAIIQTLLQNISFDIQHLIPEKFKIPFKSITQYSTVYWKNFDINVLILTLEDLILTKLCTGDIQDETLSLCNILIYCLPLCENEKQINIIEQYLSPEFQCCHTFCLWTYLKTLL